MTIMTTMTREAPRCACCGRWFETRKTRFARLPLYEGDDDWDHGYQCISLPPQPDGHGDWTEIDADHDKYAVWGRWRF